MTELQDEQLKNPEQRGKKSLRIIHIEDNEHFRDLLGRRLKKFPDVELVESFSSTEEAEEYLIGLRNEKKDLPDMVVSDNDLGDRKRTGIQFAEDLRQKGFEIKVILLTNDTGKFVNVSKEDLNRMGLERVVGKQSEINSPESLVGILKEINL